jgi:hypothetical protein
MLLSLCSCVCVSYVPIITLFDLFCSAWPILVAEKLEYLVYFVRTWTYSWLRSNELSECIPHLEVNMSQGRRNRGACAPNFFKGLKVPLEAGAPPQSFDAFHAPDVSRTHLARGRSACGTRFWCAWNANADHFLVVSRLRNIVGRVYFIEIMLNILLTTDYRNV